MKFSLNELYELSKFNPVENPDLHPYNDYYGHASILKKYLNLPADYQFKAVIEHSPAYTEKFYDPHMNSKIQAMFVVSSFRAAQISSRFNKTVFAIGPYIHYAPHLLDKEALEKEKKRLGKNLLVFPAHSVTNYRLSFDVPALIQKIKQIGKDFDTIRISLGWQNILDGDAEIYIKNGFEIVTAGNIMNQMFLSRLKSIIELATMTVSNIIGTQIGYCVIWNKPHFVIKTLFQRSGSKIQFANTSDPNDFSSPGNKASKEILDAFMEIRDDITPKQREIIDRYWGMQDIKSVKDMYEILGVTEELYRKENGGIPRELKEVFGKYEVKKRIRQAAKKTKIIISGSGSHTHHLLKEFPYLKKRVVAISDRYKVVKNIENIPVIHEDEISGLEFDAVLISSQSYEKSIYKRLRQNGIPGEKIFLIYHSKKNIGRGLGV
jgi:hypothetical protein